MSDANPIQLFYLSERVEPKKDESESVESSESRPKRPRNLEKSFLVPFLRSPELHSGARFAVTEVNSVGEILDNVNGERSLNVIVEASQTNQTLKILSQIATMLSPKYILHVFLYGFGVDIADFSSQKFVDDVWSISGGAGKLYHTIHEDFGIKSSINYH
ncbi:hypothetical protein HQ533_00105 [Candidatus Woesearchaeota archaeon]|nr:hypothetical protein [Candidatus Woesearchaeota archaeon]